MKVVAIACEDNCLTLRAAPGSGNYSMTVPLKPELQTEGATVMKVVNFCLQEYECILKIDRCCLFANDWYDPPGMEVGSQAFQTMSCPCCLLTSSDWFEDKSRQAATDSSTPSDRPGGFGL